MKVASYYLNCLNSKMNKNMSVQSQTPTHLTTLAMYTYMSRWTKQQLTKVFEKLSNWMEIEVKFLISYRTSNIQFPCSAVLHNAILSIKEKNTVQLKSYQESKQKLLLSNYITNSPNI